jgi:DinB superfamily
VANSAMVGLVFGAWSDLERVLGGLDTTTATRQMDGGSSFAWTLAHLSNQIDAWLNVRFFGQVPHLLINQERWRTGGTGAAQDWPAIQNAAADVRLTARGCLHDLRDADLAQTAPYTGRIAALQGGTVTLRYSLARTAAHHYFHIGEIATIRSRRLGESVGGYPGSLSECF